MKFKMFVAAVVSVVSGMALPALADPQLCDAFARTAQGTIIARDNGTSLTSLQDEIAEATRGTQMYDPLMDMVIKTYEGFPNATPEQAYDSTYAQCMDSMKG